MALETHREEKLQSPAVATRPILLLALGALLLLAGAIGVLQAVYYWQVPVQHYPAPEAFPQPRVTARETDELQQLEAKQQSRLEGYHWVDREHGVVQIPIERAMQLLAQEGMGAYAPLAAGQALAAPGAGAQRLTTPTQGHSP